MSADDGAAEGAEPRGIARVAKWLHVGRYRRVADDTAGDNAPLTTPVNSDGEDSHKSLPPAADGGGGAHGEAAAPGTAGEVNAVINTVKSFVGAGILALPYALSQSGLYAGLISIILIGIISNYSMKLLIWTAHQVPGARSYGDIGAAAFRGGRVLVDVVICLAQVGTAIGYIVFMCDNLHSVVPTIPIWEWALLLTPFLFMLLIVRNLKWLVPGSMFGLLALFVAIVVVFYYGFSHIHLHRFYPIFDWQHYPLFFGLAVFAFEGINLVIPIQNSMKRPQNYPVVLDISMLFVGILYEIFSICGYLFFGQHTQSVITLNLPPGHVVVAIVQIGIVIELLFTYPIQMFPVTEILETVLRITDHKWKVTLGNVLRLVLLCGTVVVAITVPFVDLIFNLVGGLCFSIVGFVLPALFHILICRKSLRWWNWIIDVFIILLGIVAAILTTTLTMISLVQRLADEF